MTNSEKVELFRQIISNKYRIYNSLFLNLPHEKISYTGIFIPLLHQLSVEGFKKKLSPKQVMETFFEKHTETKTEKERFDLMFRIVQYVERQIVLFDCIEDAAFTDFKKYQLQYELSPKNTNRDGLIEHFENFSARLVFTAHPTQFYANEVQIIMHEMRQAVKDDDVTKIDDLLRQLAFTPFVKREKPTPFDEAQSIIYYLRHVYYQTIGRLYHKITRLSEKPTHYNPSLIELGFWPGGDRDGNPFVNAQITMKVALLLRNTVMKCYYNHLKLLRRKLTFSKVVPELTDLKNKLYKQIFSDEIIVSDKDILEVLQSVRGKVMADYDALFINEIDDFIGRVHLFGSHFATLDIRQDSSKHLEAITSIFKFAFHLDYNSLSHAEKIEHLTQKTLQLNPADFDDDIVRDTLENIYQIAQIQSNNGARGLHRYIISNSESIFDVLHVYALFRYCNYQASEINIDIVPLFETMIGMNNAQKVMEELYELDVYKTHLQRRKNEQTIMLGFSDGTKDGGYLKANWEIYSTKEKLSLLSKSKNIHVVFFDGRGGPPARGGGKTHQFYASQGEEIASEKIQLTIQGQTITSIYGTHEQATYNIEQLILAGARNLRKPVKMTKEQKELLSELADRSYEKYTALKNHPLFVSYLEEMTTLKYYGSTNIGSRPTKRNTTDKLTLRDLRAIPFVGSWSLIRQNVPGYYGLGTALDFYKDRPEVIENLYASSPFFRTLIFNSMMSMKKSYFPLTAYMQNDPVYGDFWKGLREEYELSKKWVLLLTKQNELMDSEKTARLSISARENIVLPLLTIQQYALQMIQANDADTATYKKLVVRTLFGNINASRNSA